MVLRQAVVWGLAGVCAVALGSGGSFPARVLPEDPKIDGDLGDPAWTYALRLDQFQDQATGGPTADRTEAWVGVTAAGIWVAVYCHDAEPDKIVSRVIQKGGSLENDDYCGLIIDPMNRRSFSGNSQFFVNALGTQFENIAGGRAAKKEWRGSWQSACRRVADGYIVELMVPWRVLQFPAGRQGDVLFNIGRVQQRTRAVSYAIDVGRPFRADNHGTLLGVPFPKRDVSDQLDLMGYVSPEYDPDSDPKTSLRAGLDLRYRPTETLTTVLSVSPDFKNIESEVEGIGFTRTERFLSDVRPFFTEGSQYFNLTSGFGFGRAFYSNRIDDFDLGFKVFGDLDPRQSVGLLATREDGRRTDSVARYSYRFGPRSVILGFGTSRNEPGNANTAFGGQAIYGTGNYEFGLEFMQTRDLGQPGQAGRFYADYDVPNYFLTVSGIYVQPEVRNRLGFIPFTDKFGGYVFQEYNRELRSGPIRSVHMSAYLEDFNRQSGSNLSRSMSFESSLQNRADWEFYAGYERETFEDEVAETYSLGAGWNVSNRFRQLSVNYNWGDQDGSFRGYFTLNGQWRLAKGLDFGIGQSTFRLGGSRDQTVATLGWEIDPEQSLTGRFVRTDKESNWYVAYRKSGGLGLEYFFIFGDPNAQEFRNRAAFKVVWAR
ncbi:MAG: hypothetical protein JSS71_04355 [Armatimonadetes bacterium]|nr:hypothetical protein [Armatimonadota bacterium]MBX3108615.1 hypothetical protein [Fimbriimonadaceae bacterium]